MTKLSRNSTLAPAHAPRIHSHATHGSFALLLTTIFIAVSFNIPAALAADSTVNYDTAWTYVYDGGRLTGTITGSIGDDFKDVKALPDGGCICLGSSADSLDRGAAFLIRFDSMGKAVWKKMLRAAVGTLFSGNSIIIAKNGDFIIGGSRYFAPWILRTDTLGNIKWATFYYDTVQNRSLLQGNGTVNCVRETKRGTIICAAGDYFTDLNYVFGNSKYDYAAVLVLDSTGKLVHWGQAGGQLGYASGGFDIEETSTGNYMLSGNQSILYMDTTIHQVWEKNYSFMLNGVGSEVNNITRCKKLRDGTLMIAGQAYEGNCWTNFKQLYFDAWWSPISYSYGTNATWDTAGFQGGDDRINDFTQLTNGNLVFVGDRAFGPGGIWTFVTDSTGKNLLWEKQTPIPYKSNDGASATAYSVCATADGGFTVAGELILSDALGGHNAMAAHFMPILSGVVNVKQSNMPVHQLAVRLVGKRLVVTNATPKTFAVVSVFDVAGKMVAMRSGLGEIAIDVARMAKGTYVVNLKTENGNWAGRVVILK